MCLVCSVCCVVFVLMCLFRFDCVVLLGLCWLYCFVCFVWCVPFVVSFVLRLLLCCVLFCLLRLVCVDLFA